MGRPRKYNYETILEMHNSGKSLTEISELTGASYDHVSHMLRRMGIPPSKSDLPSDPVQRFWTFVTVGGEDECWIWNGNKLGSGYGCFYDPSTGIQVQAHKFAYKVVYGNDLLDREEVCHSCDTPLCVNRKHLWAGTHTQNMQDMVKKNRRDCRGERNGRSKLTDNQVREIRKLGIDSKNTHREISRLYSVSRPVVDGVINRTLWKHVIE